MQNIRVNLVTGMEPVKAFVTVVTDDGWCIEDIKIRDDGKGPWVQMPQRKKSDGTYKDIAHAVTKEGREEHIAAIMQKYEEEVAKA